MQQFINNIRRELQGLYSHSELSALIRIILEEALNIDYIRINHYKINNLSLSEVSKVEDIVSRLKKNEPIQYVIGKTEFFGLNFKVTPDVLIPRPETEELVDWILSENTDENYNILDIGTGSGCIAVTLAKKLPGAEVHACDISKDALNIAIENARLNDVIVNFLQLDVLSVKAKQLISQWNKFDLIVSNPPYVMESEKKSMDANVLRFEPHKALFVTNENPLVFYDVIADLALNMLKDRGMLYCEINRALGEELILLLENKGFEDVELRKDISGNFRMIKGVKNR